MAEQSSSSPSRGPNPAALVAFAVMVLASIGVAGWGLAGADDGGGDPEVAGSTTTTTTAESDGPRIVEASGGTRIADGEVAAIADEMTEGLAAGDFERYAASFDMPPEHLEVHRKLFENFVRLPLVREEMVALEFDGRAFDSGGGEVRTSADVAFVHQFDGADPRPVAERYSLELVKASPDAPTRVVGLAGSEMGAELYPQPWDLGQIHVAIGARSILVGIADDAELLDRAVARTDAGAGAALDDLGPVDDRPLPPKVVMVVPGPGQTTGDLLSPSANRTIAEPAGVAFDQITAPYEDIEGNRIANDDDTTFEGAGRILLSRDQVVAGGTHLEIVAAHETAHLVQYAWRPTREERRISHEVGEDILAAESLERWMIEGFADYVGNRYLGGATGSPEYRLALAAARRGEAVLHGDADSFYAGGSEALNTRYGLGMTAFMFIEDTRGREAALRFAQRVFRAPSGEGIARAYAEVLGTNRADFEASWRSWLGGRA